MRMAFTLSSLLELMYHVQFPLILVVNLPLGFHNMLSVLLTHSHILVGQFGLDCFVTVVELKTHLPIQLFDIMKCHF